MAEQKYEYWKVALLATCKVDSCVKRAALDSEFQKGGKKRESQKPGL